jgi:tape measure domain-containing protein
MNLGATIFTPLERAGKAAALRIGAAMRAAISTSLAGIGLGAGAFGVAYPLMKGLDRLKTLQKADVQLGLKLDPEGIKQVKSDVEAIVKGTPISLDQAMAGASKAVGAGIKPGPELNRYLRNVANATASSGGQSDYGWVESLFSQVRSKGKLQLEELQQFDTAGVYLKSALMQTFQWDEAEFQKQLSKGKIGMEQIQQAAEQTWGKDGGLALKMGETFDGAVGNMQASIARLGAKFLTAMFGGKTDGLDDPLKGATVAVGVLTEKFNALGKWVDANRDDIRATFTAIKDTAVSVGTAIKDVTGFLKDNKSVLVALGAAYAGWKALSVTATLADNLTKVNRLLRGMPKLPAVAAATTAANAGAAGGAAVVGGGGGKKGRFGKLGRIGGKALRAVPFLGAGMIAYDILQEMEGVREFTDEIPGWFNKAKDAVAETFTSDKVRKFFEDGKRFAGEFATTAGNAIKDKLGGAWDAVKGKASGLWNGLSNKIRGWIETAKTTVTGGFQKAWDTVGSAFDTITGKITGKLADWFGPNSWIGKALSALGIGEATANAAPPNVPTNRGPTAPPGANWGGGSGDFGSAPSAAVPGGAYMGDEALLSRITSPGRYVTAGEFQSGDPNLGDLTQGLGDCTSSIQDLVAIIDGQPTMGRTLPDGQSMYTGTAQQWAEENGFIRTDKPMPGTFQIGFFHNGAGAAGHMQATLPDGKKFNWGDDASAQASARGEGTSGAWDDPRFTHHYYRPVGQGGNGGDGYAPMTPDELTDPALTNPTPPSAPNANPGVADRAEGWVAERLADIAGLIPRLGFASGGGISGPGTATSDSIPAMLSRGEHVLTAKDVRRMGGQGNVYAFRAALAAGKVPGFAEGGDPFSIFGEPVDPNAAREQAERFKQLSQDVEIAKAQQAEVAENPDASPGQRLSAEQGVMEATRAQTQEMATAAAIASGQPAPDFTIQNNLQDTAYGVANAQANIDALNAADPTSVMPSDRMQAEYGLENANRARFNAIEAAKNQQPGGEKPDFLKNLIRTQGFTPSGGGGKAGTSSLAGFIDMGSDVIGGVIDTGASLLETAASAAITGAAAAGTFGAGAAAAPAASAAAGYGIKLGAAQIKRVVSYGFELAGIGADALVSQLFPLGGPPRWMGYDYTQMAPNLGITQAATTTLEQMGQQAISQRFGPGQAAYSVPQVPGGSPAPASGPAAAVAAPAAPAAAPIGPGGNGAPQTPLPPGDRSIGSGGDGANLQRPPWKPGDPLFPPGFAEGGAVGVYDSGGVLGPGDVAVNKSKTPEAVLTKQQWDAMAAAASTPSGSGGGPMVKIDAIYGMDPADVAAQIEQKQRLASMRYAGRPF